jgi:hypothetical protein
MSTRPVFPTRNSELPPAVEEKSEVWKIQPEDIGLTDTRVTALKAANAVAAAAYTSLIAKRDAAENATSIFNNACRTVRQLAGQCVRSIDAFAIASPDPAAVWDEASIPAPKTPGTLPPPGQPTDFTAGIDGNGALTIKWKCSNPRGVSGVIYQITRRLNNTGAYTFLDTVGAKKFVDGTIPAGTFAVSYKVVGKHGQQVGTVSDQFTVQFGVEGPGLTIAETFVSGKAAA